jgi:hypothetical protein
MSLAHLCIQGRICTHILASDNGPGTYSQLLIINEYATRLAKDLGVDENDLHPAGCFELMGGVGFGGSVELFYQC